MYLLDTFGRPVLTAPLDVAQDEDSFDLTGLMAGMYVARYDGTARKVVLLQ